MDEYEGSRLFVKNAVVAVLVQESLDVVVL
jgi:hypothetical protein